MATEFISGEDSAAASAFCTVSLDVTVSRAASAGAGSALLVSGNGNKAFPMSWDYKIIMIAADSRFQCKLTRNVLQKLEFVIINSIEGVKPSSRRQALAGQPWCLRTHRLLVKFSSDPIANGLRSIIL